MEPHGASQERKPDIWRLTILIQAGDSPSIPRRAACLQFEVRARLCTAAQERQSAEPAQIVESTDSFGLKASASSSMGTRSTAPAAEAYSTRQLPIKSVRIEKAEAMRRHTNEVARQEHKNAEAAVFSIAVLLRLVRGCLQREKHNHVSQRETHTCFPFSSLFPRPDTASSL